MDRLTLVAILKTDNIDTTNFNIDIFFADLFNILQELL